MREDVKMKMIDHTIVFGSPEANAILEADQELRKREDRASQSERWYIVSCEETNVANYRVKAIDAMDAMDRCGDDGEHIELVDCVDFEPREATLDTNQDA
jgi:hypothetical protein